MADLNKSILQIDQLEALTKKNTVLHKLEPTVKLIITIIYLIVVISIKPNQVSGLIPFIFYPIILMTMGEIPFKYLFFRIVLVLPFIVFTGIWSLIYNREIAFYILGLGVSGGLISFSTLLLKTILTVLAVLILISTTSINDLTYTMIGFKIPSIIVIQIMMTFRYISVLLEEISVMYYGYILRAPKAKGIKVKDMGTFLGQLIIRSFDRAELIYDAMKCRGFGGTIFFTKKQEVSKKGWIYIVLIGGLLIFMRFINLSKVIGNILV
jgi:cobalt/nickel transport system permease protein